MKSQFLIRIAASAVGWFLFFVLCFPAFAWVDRSGRGFNPRPAQDRLRDEITIFDSYCCFSGWLVSVFCPLFPCFRVGGSFRSGVQPPTGSRTGSRVGSSPAQDRLKMLIFFPLFVGWVFRGAEDAAEEVDFRFVRFGAQY